jgi:alpha-beta hydrolase superfamily lysophospholipase
VSSPIKLPVKLRAKGDREIDLQLTRFVPHGQLRGSVIILHGATASSRTFIVPGSGSLVAYLTERGYDVWLLDWRGGKVVADGGGVRLGDRDAFTMDAVAELDIPAALQHVQSIRESEHAAGMPLHVIAHCFGAGCLAMSIAADKLAPFPVTNVVLLTLGLFYVVPWDGFIKADDFVIERVLGSAPDVMGIHPDAAAPRSRKERLLGKRPPRAPGSPANVWPDELEDAYEIWPRQLLPTCDDPLCHRVAFMFGHPYLEAQLAPGIHTRHELKRQFGSMPIALYLHAGQNVRRGFAAPIDARACACVPNDEASRGACATHRYLRRAPFERHHVTLITGTENGIWHPDSIHRMHEHLMSGTARRSYKHVLRGYGHQDLLWGKHAARDVFPRIEQGLEQR